MCAHRVKWLWPRPLDASAASAYERSTPIALAIDEASMPNEPPYGPAMMSSIPDAAAAAASPLPWTHPPP